MELFAFLRALCQYDWLLLFFWRCVPNARRLEFMYIWQTAMVRPMYPKYFFPNYFLCYSLWLYYFMERFLKCQKDDTNLVQLTKLICVQWILINDFYPLRGRLKDPHIQWSNELYEPSTYFCNSSWCRDVYSTAKGRLKSTNIWKTSLIDWKLFLITWIVLIKWWYCRVP